MDKISTMNKISTSRDCHAFSTLVIPFSTRYFSC